MNSKIFTGFLVLFFSALLWLVPITDLVYGFRTDITVNDFYITTGPGDTTATITLSKAIYNSDNSTLSFFSDLNTDVPVFVSYNSVSRAVSVAGLSDNATRTLEVSYDTSALSTTSWDAVLNLVPAIWMGLIILFPIVGLVVILVWKFRNRK